MIVFSHGNGGALKTPGVFVSRLFTGLLAVLLGGLIGLPGTWAFAQSPHFEQSVNLIGLHDPSLMSGESGTQSRGAQPTDMPSNEKVMNFEDLSNLEPLLGFYSGEKGGVGSGPGPDWGVDFTDNALAIVSAENGGTGRFVKDDASRVLFFLDGTEAIFNSSPGFSESLNFEYCAAFYPGWADIYAQPDGKGDLLQRISLPLTPPTGESGYEYDNWQDVNATFTGVARSVVFVGAKNFIGFDNIKPGPTVVPDPIPTMSEWGLIILSVLMLITGVIMHRRMHGLPHQG
jgi:hypothetical protein